MDLWKANQTAVSHLLIEQIIATAGDGALKDNSFCSAEFREYLGSVSIEKLLEYADRCLTNAFTNSGRALQDIVNEVGRRLDFEVTGGRYQGLPGHIGFDGLWVAPEGHGIVVEVKTTDAYRISLSTIAKYREALIAQKIIGGESSILVIVGREDTGELEAQVRGSRHAWDIRLLSIDALFTLADLKQNTDDPETAEKIRRLLIPFDYTRLDPIIDVMFTAAKDVGGVVEEVETPPDAGPVEVDSSVSSSIDITAINAKRSQILRAVSKQLNVVLIKKTRATYWDTSHSVRIACSVSKAYSNKSIYRYWYAYHPKWDDFLADASRQYVVWGCLDLDVAFMIPREVMHSHLAFLSKTEKEGGKFYWHIKILVREGPKYFIQLSNSEHDLSIDKYVIKLD